MATRSAVRWRVPNSEVSIRESVLDLRRRHCTSRRGGVRVREDVLGSADCGDPLQDACVPGLARPVLSEQDGQVRVELQALVCGKGVHVLDVVEEALRLLAQREAEAELASAYAASAVQDIAIAQEAQATYNDGLSHEAW